MSKSVAPGKRNRLHALNISVYVSRSPRPLAPDLSARINRACPQCASSTRSHNQLQRRTAPPVMPPSITSSAPVM